MDHTDNVSTKTIKKIVKNCSPEDFISVLKEYGDAPTVDRSGRKIGNDIDIIASCLSSVFCKARNKKRALLAAYIGKSGVFAKDQPVPESAVSALQKKVAELTATADELTARAGKSDALTARVTELEETKKTFLASSRRCCTPPRPRKMKRLRRRTEKRPRQRRRLRQRLRTNRHIAHEILKPQNC